MIATVIGAIAALSFYLVVANAVGGPGGDAKAFEKGKQNVVEAVRLSGVVMKGVDLVWVLADQKERLT